MKDYFEIEDFVTDEGFQRWVLNADEIQKKFWNSFLLNNPDKKILIEHSRKLLLSLDIKYEQPFSIHESREIWKSIESDIVDANDYQYGSSQHTNTRKLNNNSILFSAMKYAAIIAVSFGLAWATFILNSGQGEIPNGQITIIEKVNPYGVKSHIKLSDGTHVWLNSGSSISYQEGFTQDIRMLNLKGEAYFKVAKDTNRPFKVVSQNLITTALGTEFNVKSYKGEEIKISLIEGKVEVTSANEMKSIVLLPGDQVSLKNSDLHMSIFKEDIVTSWKDGVIKFEKTDFNEMISVLEKWYDVRIEVKNISSFNQSSIKATGTFKNETLKNVLEVLSHSMKFQYSLNDKNVTLKF